MVILIDKNDLASDPDTKIDHPLKLIKMKKLIIILSAAALMCGCGKTTTTRPSNILAGRIHYDCTTVYAHKRLELWGVTADPQNNNFSTQLLGTTVTDIVGRRCTAPVSGCDIDVSALPAGVYVLHVSDRGATIVRRFLKE
jgi:hypothetical protein